MKIRKKKHHNVFLIGQTVLPDRSIDNSPKMTEKAKYSNFLITCKKIQIISIEIVFEHTCEISALMSGHDF